MNATDKAKLIDRVRSIEGLTDDERAALLGLLNESKTYGLFGKINPKKSRNGYAWNCQSSKR